MELTQTEQELINPTFKETHKEPFVFQEQIDTLINLADLISKSIATAKTLKIETSRLVNARGWLIELSRVLGNTEDYEYNPDKQSRQLMSVVLNGEIKILSEIVDFIEQVAPSFQEAITSHNQPLVEKIKKLQELGEKTKEDQQEAYSQMVILIYPYFQLVCQNLMEAKFQYEVRS